jgi:hypothetical protein
MDDEQMMKLSLSLAAVVSLSACMGGMDGDNVLRNYTGRTQCSGFTGISATYINNNSGLATRCGPQTESPYTFR